MAALLESPTNPQPDDGIVRSFESSSKESMWPPAGMAWQLPHLTLPWSPFKQRQPPTQSFDDGGVARVPVHVYALIKLRLLTG